MPTMKALRSTPHTTALFFVCMISIATAPPLLSINRILTEKRPLAYWHEKAGSLARAGITERRLGRILPPQAHPSPSGHLHRLRPETHSIRSPGPELRMQIPLLQRQ